MNRIAELRKEKKMSQISLGMKLNVSQKMISAYENGKNEPSIDLLMRMADIFHASIDYIVGYSENRFPEYPISKTSFSSPSSRDMNRLFSDLSDRNKWIAQGIILGLLASQQEELWNNGEYNQDYDENAPDKKNKHAKNHKYDEN